MTPRVVFPLNDSVWNEGKITGMTPRTNPSRHWLACCCLAVAWALANWGGMVLNSILAGWLFIAWWSLCAALALFSVVLAFVEVIHSWRGLRDEQRRCQSDQRRHLDQEAQEKKAED